MSLWSDPDHPADRAAHLECGHVIEYERAASGWRFALGAPAYCPVHNRMSAVADITETGKEA